MQKYYITIRARSDVGSVEVVSDGVVILEEGGTPTGAAAMDGVGCQNYDPGKGSHRLLQSPLETHMKQTWPSKLFVSKTQKLFVNDTVK